MFKTQVVSLSSFEHFMASFTWPIRVQIMTKSGRFVFVVVFFYCTITRKIISGIGFIFRCEIVKTKRARVLLQSAAFSWSVLSSTIALSQSARENSDSY